MDSHLNDNGPPVPHFPQVGRRTIQADDLEQLRRVRDKHTEYMPTDLERAFEQGAVAFLASAKAAGCVAGSTGVVVDVRSACPYAIGFSDRVAWFEGVASLPFQDGNACGAHWARARTYDRWWAETRRLNGSYEPIRQEQLPPPLNRIAALHLNPFILPDDIGDRVLAGKPVHDIPEIEPPPWMRRRLSCNPAAREAVERYEAAVAHHDALEAEFVCGLAWLRGLISGWDAGLQGLRSEGLRDQRLADEGHPFTSTIPKEPT